MVTRLLVNCFYPFRKSGNVAASHLKTVAVTDFFLKKLFSFALFTCFITYFLLAVVGNTYAQTAGDYRSITTGNWKAIGTWETYNGASWIAASAKPTSANGVIQIRAGHTVTVDTIITADQVRVDLLGTLNVDTTFNIANGAGTDITINGNLNVTRLIAFAAGSSMDDNFLSTLKSTGIITAGAGVVLNVSGRFKREGGTMPLTLIWSVNNGGTFEHAMNAGTLPSATWKTGSTCEVTGTTITVPLAMNQTFKSFKWNCSSQSGFLNFAQDLENIEEDFTVTSTGSSSILLGMQGNSLAVTIGRNLYIQGGITYICLNGSGTITLTNGDIVVSGGEFNFNLANATSYGNESAIVTVNGDVLVNGGTIDMSQCNSNVPAKGIGTMYISGDLKVSGSAGRVTETSDLSHGNIYFNGNSVIQYFESNTNITNTINYIINPIVSTGAIVSTGENVFTGSGTFTLTAGGGLMMGHQAGITKTTITGNVQCTGTRSYHIGADYTYDGTQAQESGDGLPAQVRDLTLNNVFNCSLTSSTSVSDTLTFTNGIWITPNDTLTLGISTTVRGTLVRTIGHVYGHLARWLNTTPGSNVLFPVGAIDHTNGYYNGANFSFTVNPTTGGRLVATFVTVNPGTNGFPLLDTDGTSLINVGYRYWQFGAANGFAGGTYNVNLYANGFPGVNNYQELHLIRKTTDVASVWTITNAGTHTAGTGSNAAPVGNRIGMTALGIYGITSGLVNPLPIQLISFQANLENELVKLNWTTASETNNESFAVERSVDGKEFSLVTKVPGAGTSTQAKYYSAIDLKPLYGRSYYRLKQTDFDGRFTYSSPVVVYNLTKSDEQISIVMVSPIPFSNSMTAVFKVKEDGDCRAEMISHLGLVVHAERIHAVKGFNTFTYENAKNLSPGVYFFRIISETKFQSATRKVVKE